MTIINSQEDFLRALAENPQWREAVRAQLLGENLLQLPARFDTFVERMDVFIEEQKQINAEQKQINAELKVFVEEQKQFNAGISATVAELSATVKELSRQTAELKELHYSIDRRLHILSNDVAQAKGGHARWSTIHEAPSIVLGLNLERSLGLKYVRDVTMAELATMAHNAAGGDIPTNELRSFSRADLVIEVEDASGDTSYLAVEASFTATQRDASRARRNTALLTRFTGKPAHAVIASVRNDRNAEAEIAAGNVWWHELEERDMEVE